MTVWRIILLKSEFRSFFFFCCVAWFKANLFISHSEIHLSRQKRFPANFISAYGRSVDRSLGYVSSLQMRCLWLLVQTHTIWNRTIVQRNRNYYAHFYRFGYFVDFVAFFRHSHLHSAEHIARSWHALYIFTIRNNHLTDWKVHNFCAHDFNHDHFKYLRFSQVSHSLTIADDRHESSPSAATVSNDGLTGEELRWHGSKCAMRHFFSRWGITFQFGKTS